MQGIEKRVSDPREYLLIWAPQLQLAKELGVLRKSLFFPYGAIEGEPTFPLTNLNFAERRALHYTSGYAGLEGTMANSQTFLMQLPNIYYFTHFGWDDDTDKSSDRAVLETLGKLLFPQKADLLAQAWTQLQSRGSEATLAEAGRVDELVKSDHVGWLGTLGGYIFPEPPRFWLT